MRWRSNSSRVTFSLHWQDEDEPYGVLMEFKIDDAIFTLTSFGTGDASLYWSTGGGVIGGIGHDSVRAAAKKFVAESKKYTNQMVKTETFPPPENSNVRFYVLTTKGILTTEVNEQELGEQKYILSPLFYAGQDVITALRLVTDKK